jgi:hypothetical protein
MRGNEIKNKRQKVQEDERRYMHHYRVHMLTTSSIAEEGMEVERRMGGFYLGDDKNYDTGKIVCPDCTHFKRAVRAVWEVAC